MTSAPEGKIGIKRRNRPRRGRRPVLLAGGAGLALALTSAFSIASFTGVDIAGAAVARAESLADLLSKRSPGTRTEAHLNKTKHKHYRVLAEREAAPLEIPTEIPAPLLAAAPITTLPEFTLPAVPELGTLAQSAPVFPAIFAPIPGGGGILAPGGGGTGPGGGPGGPPGQQPPPSGSPTETPPAVPEPATWAMMILGFGTIGLASRRRRDAERGSPTR